MPFGYYNRNMFELSKDQEKSLSQMLDFYSSMNKSKDFMTLGGFAGTGKTTLISQLRKEIEIINPKAKG